MRALPSADFGPVERPPCSGQRHLPRLVLIAVALHRLPARWRRPRARIPARMSASSSQEPQTCLGIAQARIRTVNTLIWRGRSGLGGITQAGRPRPRCFLAVTSAPATPPSALCCGDALAPFLRLGAGGQATVQPAAPGAVFRLDRLAFAWRPASSACPAKPFLSHGLR